MEIDKLKKFEIKSAKPRKKEYRLRVAGFQFAGSDVLAGLGS
jgi:hypothetical protein